MRVFVTGGAGYIGSITSHLLSLEGHEVVIYDDLSTGHREVVPSKSIFIEGNILDFSKLCADMQGCEAVLHFAGRAIVSESFEKSEEYHKINVIGSANVFNAAIQNGIRKIVVASSCAVYGNDYSTAISENFKEAPINPYGLTKLQMDESLREIVARNLYVGAISLRFFNVAGALYSGGKWIGENHSLETHVIPNLLRANKSKPFQLYGNDYQTPDGTCVRDFVHVVDIAKAYILSLQKIQSGEFQVFNLGSNAGNSLLELIDLAGSILGLSLPVEIRDRRLGDPDSLVADYSKAKSLLGWDPKFNLRKMIEDHLEYNKLSK